VVTGKFLTFESIIFDMAKINSNSSNFKFKILNLKFPIFIFFFFLLTYTRFINIGWGLPYPMHPDERNIAVAVQNLNCEVQSSKFKVQSCFNPHFYAYGQFPLYLGHGLVWLLKFFNGRLGTPISFLEATISLRTISAIASVINALMLIKIIQLISNQGQNLNSKRKLISNHTLLITSLILIFSPYFIQFSHFGTTESLLMLFYSLIIYLCLLFFQKILNTKYFILYTSFISGLAIATKVSSAVFIGIPLIAIINSKFSPKGRSSFGRKSQNSNRHLKAQNHFTSNFLLVFLTFTFLLSTFIFTILFSPHNLINWQEFIGALRYESEVATGAIKVFYTRQFEGTVPYWFQLTKIFPYALGWPVFVLGILAFSGLSWRSQEINLLRLAFLFYFIPNGLLYAKWTRFMAPIFPLILIFSIFFLLKLYDWFYNYIRISSKFKIQNSKLQVKIKNFKTFDFLPVFLTFTFLLLTFISILPGISYLSVYQKLDVRFQASKWIYENIPDGSYILSETANVVDIPTANPKSKMQNPNQVQNSNYKIISFNFYDLDENPQLQEELKEHLAKVDYIFVPSRRIFANHYCGSLSSRPTPTLRQGSGGIFGNKCQMLKKEYPLLNDYYEKLFSGKLGFEKVAEFSSGLNDEQAEETWSVFDHLIIRIFKRNSTNPKSKQTSNF